MPEAPSWAGDAIGVSGCSVLEAEAIQACLRGQAEGLAILYEMYRLPVFRTSFRLLGERASAEDATQEIFLRVFERISTFGGQSAFSTWLYRLAVNHCLNLLDKRKRRAMVPVEDLHHRADVAGEPEEAYARSQRRDRLVRLIGVLSVDHRTVLVLREIEDLSYSEIAAVLEVPLGTVMSRLARAREALKQLWLAGDVRPECRETAIGGAENRERGP